MLSRNMVMLFYPVCGALLDTLKFHEVISDFGKNHR